ncbi:MAG: polysaccharide deacetylase family protein [Clostridium sp.]|uniref:polysaccharide deacetylase family protein n=1 Tax=Clostridium sp. TaxID=1506 RepID=UPI0039E76260
MEESKKSIIRRSLILFIAIGILFSVSYFIGMKNKKPVASSKPFKVAEIKHTEVVKKETVPTLPKTPGKDELRNLINVNDGQKVAYLTFDDGPSPNNTPQILDILKREDVKATFFIIGKNAERNPELLVREKNEGHTIGMHSYTHEPAIIYKNPEAYLKDLDECSAAMTKAVGEDGYDKWLIRFPEGSGTVKNKPGFREAIAAAGYHYVDWNALDGDAEHSRMETPQYLMSRFTSTIGEQHHVVILMHDAAAKKSTVDTLPQFIKYLKDKGFIFKTIPKYQS